MKLSQKQKLVLNAMIDSEYDQSSREIHDHIIMPNAEGIDIGPISSMYDCMDALKKIGFVENGISNIVRGKTVLMWRLTDAGRKFVLTDISASVPFDQRVIGDAIEDKAFVAERYEADAVKTAFDDLVNAIVSSLPKREPKDVELKIETLERLMPIVSDDITDVLKDIIADLGQN